MYVGAGCNLKEFHLRYGPKPSGCATSTVPLQSVQGFGATLSKSESSTWEDLQKQRLLPAL